MEILGRNCEIFNYLCQACSELNCVFSIPVLFTVILKFISITGHAFDFIYHINYPDDLTTTNNWLMLYMVIMDWSTIYIILSAADMPITKVILLVY